MEKTLNGAKLEVVQGDITQSAMACIVNAANSSLLGGGGVDGAIHRAGGRRILDECVRIRSERGGCPVGEAVITTGGNLKAKHVIHTVGPVWNGGKKGEAEKLGNCYRSALRLAEQHGIASISFPNISTGIYGYPKDEAAEVAIGAVTGVLARKHGFERIQFVCFDFENYDLYVERVGEL
ncbi:O-acetyl-ADP-ribose deacetylase [Cohnella ginsengisoli]|uniref:O-acetyl-ADP-ribose deacetylase n=1 Tax=Cohnella ginsengisoli TaxID=425004 RepID=A0A9X4QP07_9BACL|nr:O-acetyl-ADP-ribose deacetylase [Cohnella ginsengisoli]MDG0792982.1 O-acetyl-ADP-ribose deacetylase [Cohnella ginsengisoli]